MNKKSKVLTGALISSLLLASAGAHADNKGWYGGVSLATTTVDTGISGTTGTAALDEDDSGYKVMVGKKLGKNLSIEGFYADFGEASLTGNNGDNFTLNNTTYVFTANNVSLKHASTGFGINAKLTHEFSRKFSIAGRLGWLMWDTETTVSSASTASSTSNSGTDAFYGFGFKYNISKKYALVADYDTYVDDADFNMTSLGVIFNF